MGSSGKIAKHWRYAHLKAQFTLVTSGFEAQ